MAMGDVSQLYARLEHRVMQEAVLVRYGYPRPGHAPGWARVNTHTDTRWKVVPGPSRRSCERCDKLYEVDGKGWPVVRETCTWHLRRPLRGVHPCCGRREGVGHCQNSPYHVHRNIDPDNLTGFVSTGGGVGGGGGGGGGGEAASVASLDCEMVATTRGFEVVAVSVVDHRCRVLYEALLRPEGHVLNYNTPFSGLTEADLRGVTTTLRDAHERLLALLGPRIILVGHAMHNDLLRLRLLHGRVVDTCQLYPHPRGWSVKNSLGFLKERHLPKLNEGGHKCREDAVATMMLARLKCGLRARP